MCTSKTESFEEIKNLLLEHFKPKNFVIAKSYRFYDIKEEDESISNFFICLKHLSSTCEFRTFLKRALRQICMRVK